MSHFLYVDILYYRKKEKIKKAGEYMKRVSNVSPMVIFPSDQMEKYNEYQKQYGNLPTRQIFREMARVKGEVSQEVLDQHIQNIDALSNMGGFITDSQKGRIEQVKTLLKYPNAETAKNVETEYVSGTSLLLWFLILVGIW